MAIACATRVRVRSIRFLPQYLLASELGRRRAAAAPGFRKGQVVVDHGSTFWTVTLWDDAGSMEAALGVGGDTELARVAGWCDEASAVTWEQDSDALPDMDELAQRMVSTGRFFKLPKASRAHAGHVGPMPPRPKSIRAIEPR